MAVLNRGQIRTHARLLALDSSSTNPHHTDDEVNAIINEVSVWVWGAHGPRYELVPKQNDTTLEIAADGSYIMVTTGEYSELVAVFYEGVSDTSTQGVTTGPMLEWIEYHELLHLRAQSTTAGTPKYVHWHRTQGAQTWTIMVHPPPSDATATPKRFSLLVRNHHTKEDDGGAGALSQALLTSDTDLPMATANESRLMARLAAHTMASLAGRGPDVLDNIAALIPDEIKAARGIKLHAGVGVTSMDVD